eukprot:SAG31_NODE_9996_length_1199_cov_1.251818_1_plen_219_part_10
MSDADLALQHGIAVVGGEAIQWTAGPRPPPHPSGCSTCFKEHGCHKAMGLQGCLACMEQHKFGPQGCAAVCSPEPFSDAERAVCGEDAVARHWRASEDHALNVNAIGNPHMHGGQWLIPEVQTDKTGLVCDWERNLDLRYINATLTALETAGAVGGGRLFDLERLFFTGCSMGSAYTVWVAQCVHQKMPSAVTAFASQSTGLKVKGDGLTFPPDNYVVS